MRLLALDAVRGRQDPPVGDDAAAAEVLGADDERHHPGELAGAGLNRKKVFA